MQPITNGAKIVHTYPGIQANIVVCVKSFVNEKSFHLRKVVAMVQFVKNIKEMGFKVGCFVGLFYPPEKVDILIYVSKNQPLKILYHV